ncbi:MAG: hypothetical protein KJ732_06075 [Candidatus Margulisbacteria bacterium]|nr:hypothetical protein [Candidatus Margulisiibacteriota bacterium]
MTTEEVKEKLPAAVVVVVPGVVVVVAGAVVVVVGSVLVAAPQPSLTIARPTIRTTINTKGTSLLFFMFIYPLKKL